VAKANTEFETKTLLHKKMTPEEEIYNDHEQDAKRFKNFILLVITVAAIITAMIYINL